MTEKQNLSGMWPYMKPHLINALELTLFRDGKRLQRAILPFTNAEEVAVELDIYVKQLTTDSLWFCRSNPIPFDRSMIRRRENLVRDLRTLQALMRQYIR